MTIEAEYFLRLLLSVALGAGIGLQRELAGKPAGMRTHTLIALGCSLFTVTSIVGFGSSSDQSRLAAGIVTGIGFLGAGAIIRGQQGNLAGLTTAASIWVVAAIGLAAGAGLYLLSTATAALTIVALVIPKIKG